MQPAVFVVLTLRFVRMAGRYATRCFRCPNAARLEDCILQHAQHLRDQRMAHDVLVHQADDSDGFEAFEPVGDVGQA